MRAGDDEDLESGQGLDDLRETILRDSNLEILVLAALLAQEELDRPAGRDVPGRVDSRESALRLLRAPRVPLVEVGVEASR